MIFSGVRLPDDIRIALEEERLVIFVGAGVSVPPPSHLPLFNGLASQIAGKPVPLGSEDKVLGDLAHNGTDVHAAAARILYHETTQPTRLHAETLRLFRTAGNVRVVTTNFDNHFSAVGQKLFRKPPLREYCAPALPLGDDFSGLVYLHGSARLDPQTMVLTDKDFGAAYVTRGWARDFLVPLFSKYAVLFVGYSHSDVMLKYLALGLNPHAIEPRWTLVPSELASEHRDNWTHLEVSMTEYPIDHANTVNQHQALTDFFIQWANHTSESLLSRAKRVRNIARGLPPESPKISEYLDYCLRHPRLASDFCAAIRHPAWVGWMHDHGYFKPFFEDPAAEVWSSHHNVIGSWFCSYVRLNHPELLLEVIEAHNQQLSHGFCNLFSHVLLSEKSKKRDPRFALWVSILLSQNRATVSSGIWAYLLAECRFPEDLGITIRLFELLTTPQIKLEKGWDWTAIKATQGHEAKEAPLPRKVVYSIRWPKESEYWLAEAWTKLLQPNLPQVADFLFPVVVKQLADAHLLLRTEGKDEGYDRLTWWRSSIAPHRQDEDPFQKCLSYLIDIAREILLHWIQSIPARARIQADAWWSSRVPLFRRLAIYAKSVDPQYDSDELIDWLLTNNLLFASGMKKEVFDVLASSYPRASSSARRRLLHRIGRGFRGPITHKLEPSTLAYEQFNILTWLSRADGSCALVKEAIANIKAVHPEFEEREYPDLDFVTSEVRMVDPEEEVDFDRILSGPPDQYLDELRRAGDWGPHDRSDHYNNLSTLFARNKDWGRGFVEALARDSETDREMWGAVFLAWRDTLKSSEDWEWILAIIEALPRRSVIFSGVAYLLAHNILDKGTDLGDSIVDRAATLMDEAWALCSVESEAPDDHYREWLPAAINHVGGWIGEFWIHYCSRIRERAGANWQGVPSSLKSKIADALSGTNRAKVYARIAMTPWLGYVFVWDREFATSHFLPLLDWERDTVVAQQTWSVLLNFRRGTSWELETQLIPYYRQAADRVTSMLKGATEQSEQFDDHALQNLGHCLAGLAMHVVRDPVESGFFRDFLPPLPDPVRAALAQGMDRQLERMESTEIENLWRTWLERYVDLRLVGIPAALSVAETKYMLNWCLHLGPVFPAAVDRIVKMPQQAIFAYSVIEGLLKNPVLERFPLHACRLLIVALTYEDFPHLHASLLIVHQKLKTAIHGAPELSAFEELLYLRGWEKKK
jgi:SIR2-like protein